jgi:hypothetical protein
MKQLLIPFKSKTSLGQLYYDKDPKEAEPEDQAILKDLAVFVSKDDAKLALRCVFFNKSDQKIAVSNGYILVEISTNDFKSEGVFPIKGKSTRGITFPNYVPLIPVEDRSQNYEISVIEWQKHIDQSLPLMKEYHSSTKPKIGYFHFEGDTIVSYDMNAVSLLFKKAIKWGNKTIEINYGTNSDQKSSILVFGFKSPYGKCRALLMPVFDENRGMWKEILDKNVFSYNNETEMQIKGILSISKDDFYKPLESIDKSKKAADAQAQRIRILALKYKYQIQQNNGIVEVTCFEMNNNDKVVRHKRALEVMGKGLYCREMQEDNNTYYAIYFVEGSHGVLLDRTSRKENIDGFFVQRPDFDYKKALFDEKTSHVPMHVIEFAKAVGWEYEILIEKRDNHKINYLKKDAERKGAEKERQKEREIRFKENVIRNHEMLKSNNKITYDQLIDIIKEFKIIVHPRTMGLLKKQDSSWEISTSRGVFSKSTSAASKDSIFDLVNKVAEYQTA